MKKPSTSGSCGLNIIALLPAAIALMGVGMTPAVAASFTVNSVADLGDGVCDTGRDSPPAPDVPECTLRAALQEATALGPPAGARHEISFNIQPPGRHVIVLTTPLPEITEPVYLRGPSQPRAPGEPVEEKDIPAIELRGGFPDTVTPVGLKITASRSVVENLAITNIRNSIVRGTAILVEGGQDSTIIANYIGVSAVDDDFLGNGIGIAIVNSRNNRIGGKDPVFPVGDCNTCGNIIVRNTAAGIVIRGADSSNNVVQNNSIGTSDDGSFAIPNLGDGVFIESGRDNLVGGTAPGASNTISGNQGSGVHILFSDALNNRLEGNFIGTNSDGTASVPNTLAGVKIQDAPANIVGGTVTGAGNVIAGNESDGVQLVSGAEGNRVEGNRIGTNAAGDAALPNGGSGVRIDGAPANTVGGTLTLARNLISGNGGAGVDIEGPGAMGNRLEGNRIGTNLAGDATLANSGDGVRIDGAPTSTVGGATVERGNLISGNGGAGVRILNAGANGTVLQSNFIGTNAAGNARLPNTAHGVAMVNASGSAIGANPGTNVISGNGAPGGPAAHGVFISGGGGHVVKSNRIGTNSASASLPNTGDGVRIVDSANNTVGGDFLAGEFNVISANGPTPGNGVDGAGVRITGAQATGNRVQGSFIGVNFSGFTPLGNRYSGIVVDGAANTTIGGQAGVSSTVNVIAANGGHGVEITGGATGTKVAGNRIGSNFFGN